VGESEGEVERRRMGEDKMEKMVKIKVGQRMRIRLDER
jgi:hypothetical protein